MEDRPVTRSLLSLVAGVAVAGPVSAQGQFAPTVPYDPAAGVVPVQGVPQAAGVPAVPVGNPTVALPASSDYSTLPRLRGSAEFLLWYLERPRIATPMITSLRDQNQDLAATFEAGGLADPNTVVVFGGGSAGPSQYPGFRAMVGLDLSDDGRVGIEVGGFWLPRQADRTVLASDAAGRPAVALPALFNNPASFGIGESSGVFAGNFGGTPIAGYAEALVASQLWGGDMNLTVGCCRGNCWQVEGLVGFRYVGMNDLLQLTASITGNGDGTTFDRFATTNNFYGPQVGLRGQVRHGLFALTLGNKIAFGVTDQVMNISGAAVLPSYATGAGYQLPGGFYTSAANIGRTQRTEFSIVNETNLTLRVEVTSRIGVTAGYSLFYWSEVQRPGDNVTRVVNPAFNPAFAPVAGVPPLSGPPAPFRLNNTTDFWAHGMNFGVQIGF
jgi:hypothetical protein